MTTGHSLDGDFTMNSPTMISNNPWISRQNLEFHSSGKGCSSKETNVCSETIVRESIVQIPIWIVLKHRNPLRKSLPPVVVRP